MSSATIWCVVLSIPFLLAFIAVPLWMSVKYPDRAPDHTAANLYLALKKIPATRVATANPNGTGTHESDRELELARRR